jgi:hypothetical protein
MHLSSAELVDIAEGTRPEVSAPHLMGCETCREQLGNLRAMMSLAKAVDVPEPSPLFWDHLSSRVSAAVAMEEGSARLKGSRSFAEGFRVLVDALMSLLGARAFQASVVLAASLLIVALINGRSSAPAVVDAPRVTIADAAADPLTVTADDDASLTLVASMTDGQDLDTVREAGLVARGSAEHAVTHLTDGELRELRRLLKEEIARPGA